MPRIRKADQDKAEAIARLREWIKPGDTVYTILDHVSSSGMSRAIRIVLLDCADGRAVDRHPNYAVGKALGLRHWKRHGREQDALVIGGCGMDMGFEIVYQLSQTLYGGRHCTCYGPYFNGARKTAEEYHARAGGGRVSDGWRWGADPACPICAGTGYTPDSGYSCLGKGKCPSNYHVNHRDHLRCEGTRVYNPDGPDTGSLCWAPNRGIFGSAEDVPENWPRRMIDIGEGQQIDGPLLTVVDAGPEEKGPYTVCPTCGGAGSVPNPEGPERFDLRHYDGYALRHRWL